MATELPGHASGAFAANVVPGWPRPEVSTFSSWPRSTASVSASRTFWSALARPGAWLNHISPLSAGTSAANRFAAARRVESGPKIGAALSWPDSSRFAAVVSFGMILTTILSGSPACAVVAPFGPHV